MKFELQNMTSQQTDNPPTRVVVVDDDPSVLSVVAKLLEVHDFEVETFPSAEEFLPTIGVNDIGCVVTDLKMPGMTGIDLLNELKSCGSCLAIIVVTAHADVPKTIEIMGSGAVMLIQKPFKSSQLIAEVRRALEVSRSAFARRCKVQSASQKIASLASDEFEIMQCAARGMPNKAIAMELALSPRTVDRRRQSALSKLGVSSIAEFAVLLAISQEHA